MNLKPCPACGSLAQRNDKLTDGVEGAVECSKCSFVALVTDWNSRPHENQIIQDIKEILYCLED
jgi:Zn ribbon nucleic-acid-binding protein